MIFEVSPVLSNKDSVQWHLSGNIDEIKDAIVGHMETDKDANIQEEYKLRFYINAQLGNTVLNRRRQN